MLDGTGVRLKAVWGLGAPRCPPAGPARAPAWATAQPEDGPRRISPEITIRPFVRPTQCGPLFQDPDYHGAPSQTLSRLRRLQVTLNNTQALGAPTHTHITVVIHMQASKNKTHSSWYFNPRETLTAQALRDVGGVQALAASTRKPHHTQRDATRTSLRAARR